MPLRRSKEAKPLFRNFKVAVGDDGIPIGSDLRSHRTRRLTTSLGLTATAAATTPTLTTTTSASASASASAAPLAMIVLMASVTSAGTEIALPTVPAPQTLGIAAGRAAFGGSAKVTTLIGTLINPLINPLIGARVLERGVLGVWIRVIRRSGSCSRILGGSLLGLWGRTIG